MTSDCIPTKKVAFALGLSLRQLQWWDETGLIRPRRGGGSGAGRPDQRCYSMTVAVQCGVLAELRRGGMALQKIRKVRAFIVANISDVQLHSGRQLFVLTDGTSSHLAFKPEDVVRVMTQEQRPLQCIAINDVAARIKRLAQEPNYPVDPTVPIQAAVSEKAKEKRR
jgi:hypothetical protein